MTPFPHLKYNRRTAHGGDPSIGRRRSRRPLSIKKPMHVTLRSEFAYKNRSLLKHQKLINQVLKKASRRFRISIYEKAICGNHIHLLVRGRKRFEIQNFFRVVAGHIAQQILIEHPILVSEKPKRGGALAKRENISVHPKNQRKFWCALIYSRLLSGWGKEFRTVKEYIVRNTLEAIGILPYDYRVTRSRAVPFITYNTS
jgi:REP element-mobilizing transposase RayT